ncbi:MAG TPA: GAP family protein [Patescibacteria group bacterium]|nr:GAP family protein [Patescibacteria group bacterium]
MNEGLAATILGLALLDSLNPVTIAAVALILLSPLPRPGATAAGFVLGAYLAYVVGGLAIYLGAELAGGVVEEILDWIRRVMFLFAASLLALSGARRLRTRRRTAILLPSWVNSRTAGLLGVAMTGADFPNAWPYFIAIGQLVTAGLPHLTALAVIAGYAVVYCLPCLVLIGLGRAFGHRIHQQLRSVYERFASAKTESRDLRMTLVYWLGAVTVAALAFVP